VPLTNAEKQRRWRDRRNKLATEASRLRNMPLHRLIADRLDRSEILPRDRRQAVQLLLQGLDHEEDAESHRLAW
jgi:hypothetical protein